MIRKISFITCNILILIGVLFMLQLHNLTLYPITNGFDASDHIYYIETIKKEERIPLADEGGQTDHPPLYYMVASLFNTTAQAQILGIFSWTLLGLVSFITFKKIFTNVILAGIGVIIVISLPAVIYMTPAISNELFSAVIISITLGFYLRTKSFFKTEHQLLLGMLLGLSILSKVTGFVLVLCTVIDLIYKNKAELKKIIAPLGIIVVVTFLVGGSFYLRNLILFDNPFVTTTDIPGQFINQPPGHRDLRFLTDLSGFWKLDLFKAHYYSLWAGTYFSWFYDGHNAVIPVQESSKAGTALVIFSLPLFIIFVKGFIKEIKSPHYPILITYSISLFIFYIFFNFKLPFYSSVKGAYLLSAVIPFAYFIVRETEFFKRKNLWLFMIYLNLYCILIMKNFWIL